MTRLTNSDTNLPDIIRTEGINCFGSGIIPKLVMLDTDLNIVSKAIYGLLCSYSGSGNAEFPCVANITRMLGINKDTFHKGLKELKNAGYVNTEQQKSGTKFSRNIYTLISEPPKLAGFIEERGLSYDTVSASGVKAGGFGFIAKAVMADTRLSIRAKGVYLYYCSFTGAGESASPKRSDIGYYLGISKNSLAKYKKELIDLGYIETKQRTVAGKFSCSDVIITENPVKVKQNEPCTNFSVTVNEEGSPCTNSSVAGNREDTTANLPCTKNSDTETEPACPGFSDTGISGTRNNNIRNKIDLDVFHSIREGKERKAKRSDIEKAVSLMTAWHICDCDESGAKTVNLFVEALTDMLVSEAPLKLMKESVSPTDVAEKLLDSVVPYDDERYADYIIYDLLVNATVDFEHAQKAGGIKYPIKYMQSCIWTCMKLENSVLVGSEG